MRILVCGGRNFQSPAHVWMELDRIHAETPISELMQGGAKGVDLFAREWAAARRIKRFVCHADWQTFGPAAGPLRNARMLEWKPDMVIAFPGGKGTADMVNRAKLSGIPVMSYPNSSHAPANTNPNRNR